MTNSRPGSPMFIVVDDDDVSNMISTSVIKNTCDECKVESFGGPIAALDFLKNEFQDLSSQRVLLLLNITMPIMTGWEFLDRFEALDEAVKARISVYILSASVDYRDEDRARINKHVIEFLPKPLTTEMVTRIRSRFDEWAGG